MSTKQSGQAQDPREIDRFDGGVGWIAHPEEDMQRASHALVGDDDEVWLFDPVDAEGVEELYEGLGEVVGVVVCLDRHERDAETFARRHDVPVYVAEWMADAVSGFDAEVETFGSGLPGAPFRAIPVVDNPFWHEVAFYDPERKTLLVPEAFGTNGFYRAGSERLGVHPFLRPFPPKGQFRDVSPDRILVGHGAGVMEGAAGELREALQGSRRRMPAAYLKAARQMLPV